MLTFIIPILIGLVSLTLMYVGKDLKTGKTENTKLALWCYRHGKGLSLTLFMCSAAVVVSLLLFVGCRVDYATFPSECHAVNMTLETARSNEKVSSLERAAVMHKVIDINRELAIVKYWNDSIWVGWFIPDRVAELDYLK